MRAVMTTPLVQVIKQRTIVTKVGQIVTLPRQQAMCLLERGDAVRVSRPRPAPLVDDAKRAYEKLRDNPGFTWAQLADAIDYVGSHSTFRTRIVPLLKKHGARRVPDGSGWFVPH
jgi:hypothetical protein